MKKLFFSLVATVFFGIIGVAQKNTNDTNKATIPGIECFHINAGINIGIAWVSGDVYVCCGGGFSGSWGPCRSVSKKLYDILSKNSGEFLPPNIKDFFPKYDTKEVKELEVTSSDTYVKEDETKVKIRTGKYKINADGSFELDIIKAD